ncbi:uncharacterized protein SPAPADRAFT_55616 [Spathaspora passalidarum NRRL Y-27907]|uniref:Lysophospholipase n=1 Tax=Spathaspora passalidarum (strain NRRL Y-27907 / 11-Y1) TaxID=619300 RepID=G3AP49_SPAPN|nr:uncharacterized protein SPAPADRAFT_55616 [Spathaspora passalidarum NRRL Y-27907]EGW32080.1 hypothetical protein SPAPADRAFT_55616 [Spathaspora passalidarum NRRL Y-27907]
MIILLLILSLVLCSNNYSYSYNTRSVVLDNSRLLYKNFSQSVQTWNVSYAPYTILCPSTSLIRPADDTLCEQERTYMENRNIQTEVHLKNLLIHNKIPQFDVEEFFTGKDIPITITIAISGGGYRSMLTGAGVLAALDERSKEKCQISGLLQATSYIGGISGGSWLVMSNFINDFKVIEEIRKEGWNLQESLLSGVPNFEPSGIQRHIEEKARERNSINKELAKQQPGIIGTFLKFFNFRSNSTIPVSEKVQENSILYTWIKGLFTRRTTPSIVNTPTTNPSLVNHTNEMALKEYLKFYKELLIEVKDKKRAGFHTSLTDYWGRALARKIFTTAARTPGVTMTAATNILSSFQNYEQPFPIIGTVEKDPTGGDSTSVDSHSFEFTPFEFGSWDSYLNAFIPMKYLGTTLKSGISTQPSPIENQSYCISGFDNVGFITATSSSLFNHIFVYVYQMLNNFQIEATIALENILKTFGLSSQWKSLRSPQLHPDYALYSPNPFYLYGPNTTISDSPDLYLVDGGDDGQNIPFQPFLRPARKVDIILTYDMSCELHNFPNGTVLTNTANRFLHGKYQLPRFTLQQNGNSVAKSIFPKVPTPQEILRYGLSTRPVFLGCDLMRDYETVPTTSNNVSNITTKEILLDYFPPVIVYTANSNYSYFGANSSTFQLSYTDYEVDSMINNGFNMASYLNSSLYPVCLNCIILKRQFDRRQYNKENTYIPKTCLGCYEAFCWDRARFV